MNVFIDIARRISDFRALAALTKSLITQQAIMDG